MINVCVLGNGTVGSGVVELLNKNCDYIKRRTGEDIRITKILVRDMDKHCNSRHKGLITTDITEVLKADVDIAIEAMGGLNPAYDYIKSFLKMKKHVVTANKDVIAAFGEELSAIAESQGVSLRFEASVGGGIPILKPLQECLAGNDIEYLAAILNGTTNFILSKMFNEGMKYGDALKIAQELGFAEANPDSDVLGYDSARKLAILSSISYDERINWEKISTEGISKLDETDIKYAKEEGYKVKLLAVSMKDQDKIYAAVRPALIPVDSRLGKVDNEFNGILLNGDAVGEMFFCGKGAGKLPTASAVMGDIFDVIENKKQKSMFIINKSPEMVSKWIKKAQWLLRFNCADKEPVLSLLDEYFPGLKTATPDEESQELAVFVEAENESVLDSTLELVCRSADCFLKKKLIVLDL